MKKFNNKVLAILAVTTFFNTYSKINDDISFKDDMSFNKFSYAKKKQSLEIVSTVLEKLQEENTQFILLVFTDLIGNLKEVIIPIHQAEKALSNGVTFDGSSIEGFSEINESDLIIKPDLKTLRFLPWTDEIHKTALFICDVYKNKNERYETDPRFILEKIADQLKKDYGLLFNVGTELEFFIFSKDINGKPTTKPCDNKKYFYIEESFSRQQENHVLLQVLKGLNIDIEKLHHEVAPGQHEVVLHYNTAQSIADQLIILKYALKVIAGQLNYHISFMPKPIFGQNGSGMHIHFSLFDIQNQKNAFFDSNNEYQLSKIAQNFIAGILDHILEFSALLNPTINSYKRLVAGYEAPIYICWANKNRSSMIRIPLIHSDAQTEIRAEIRCPDPSCNPYLAFAALIKAGIEGLKSEKSLPNPINQNLYKLDQEKLKELNIKSLPSSLHLAINNLENSNLAKELLTQRGLYEYLKIKKQECINFDIVVTDWEIKTYL